MKVRLQAKLTALLLGVFLLGAAAAIAAARLLARASVTLRAGVVVIVALAVAPYLARVAIRPIRRLLRSLAAAVSSYRDGELSFSMPIDRSDEIGELLDRKSVV